MEPITTLSDGLIKWRRRRQDAVCGCRLSGGEIEHAALFQLSLAGRMFALSAVVAVQPSLRGCVHLGTVALIGVVSGGGGGGGKHRTTR